MEHFSSRPALRSELFVLFIALTLTLASVAILVVTLMQQIPGEVYQAAEKIGVEANLLVRTVGLVFLGLSVMSWLTVFYRHYVWRFTIDDENIESQKGIIGRDLKSIRTRDLLNVNVKQSLVQRILGIGNVEFSTAGGGGIEVVFHGVKRPLQVKDLALSRRG